MGNSNDKVFEIECECCKAKIHVDPRTQSIFYTEAANAKKRSFEEVVKDVSTVAERAEKDYEARMEKERNKSTDHLEELFRKAKQKAEENPDEKPPSIFDYD